MGKVSGILTDWENLAELNVSRVKVVSFPDFTGESFGDLNDVERQMKVLQTSVMWLHVKVADMEYLHRWL